ncbi:Aste57867_19800 [Aphanomyces stellatus]|uniref:Aste57867_19800 protein n=1 Tax=Aphanomyces stellatus TaxID=120398 RepID=A0A485LEL9_9STRA|nr:hypothetical protein As57867_019735 [Aphanomyces stellatus]VFT96498.1 Aste57867_19800 [Aphanomyces stellatus]
MARSSALDAALVEGRRLYRTGRLQAAESCWRACLREAYTQGDLAATFVLSKNLGDVCCSHVEAVEFYEYALEIATTCGVLRDPMLRPSIALIAVAIEDLEENRETCDICHAADQRIKRLAKQSLCFVCFERQHTEVIAGPERNPCATCGDLFAEGDLTRDTDDQLYCQPCYDAYYAEASGDDDEDDEEGDDGMLCAKCLDADGTIQDWQGLFYCQPCFIQQNQTAIAGRATNSMLNVPAPAGHVSSPLAKKASTPAVSPQVSSSPMPTVPKPIAEEDSVVPSAPTLPQRLVYTLPFLLSLRQTHGSCPPAIRSSPVFMKKAMKPPAEKPPSRVTSPRNSILNEAIDAAPKDKTPSLTKAAFAQHVLSIDSAAYASTAAFFSQQQHSDDVSTPRE